MALWKVWECKQNAHSVSSVRGTKAGGRGGTEHVDHQGLKDKALIKKEKVSRREEAGDSHDWRGCVQKYRSRVTLKEKIFKLG